MNSKEKRIGFVGVGRMGANMARNLKDKGYTISCVNDVNKDAASALASELGCAHAETLAAVTAQSDIVLTVVTNDAAMESIFFGSDDNLFQGATDTLFINCATLSPAMHIRLENAAEENGSTTLEGCMASSITQAREGTLYLMIGGKQEIFDSVKDLLDDLSINLRFVGEAGRAAQVKALVNMVMNINTAALAEGLGIGDALGLDLEMLCEFSKQMLRICLAVIMNAIFPPNMLPKIQALRLRLLRKPASRCPSPKPLSPSMRRWSLPGSET
jgi:3-hydroxyisobutyrate dehydrogenase-like beta-hydroxyacid dehydrogenase